MSLARRREPLPIEPDDDAPAPPATPVPPWAPRLLAFCERHASALVAGLIGLFVLGFVAAAMLKLRYFLYEDIDLAIFTQAIEGVLEGSGFSSIRGMAWFGDHASLILVPLAPLYALFPFPLTLLALQALALGLGAVPVFRLARRELSHDAAALAFAAVWLLQPALGWVALFEFHPETLAAPMLLAAFAAVRAGSWRWATAWALIALTAREDVALVIGALGLYAFTLRRPGAVRFGLTCLAAALVWLGFYFGLAKPSLAGGGEAYAGMYRAWGASLPEALRAMVADPLRVVAALFSTPGSPADSLFKQQLWVQLLLPVAFLALASPLTLAIALPVLAEHLLSFRTQQHVIAYQYAVLIVPFVVAAAVLGARRIPASRAVVAGVALAAALVSAALFGPLGGAPARARARAIEHTVPTGFERAMRPHREAALSRIRDGGVVASFELLPRLAHRDGVHSLHHLLTGRYTFSDRPYPTPRDVTVLVADFANPRIVPLVDGGSASRLGALIAWNGLAPVTAQGDLVLFMHAPRETLGLLRPGPAPAFGGTPVAFDGQLELLGVQHEEAAPAGGTLRLRSWWRRLGPVDRLHLVQWRLIDARGRVAFEHTRHLGYVVRPPATWPKGEAVGEDYGLVLPADLASGTYLLGLRVAWRRDGRTVLSQPAPAEAASEDLTLPLGAVRVR